MTHTKNRLWAILMLLVLFGLMAPHAAFAASDDWRAPYLKTLKLAPGRRAVTLCDITRSGAPEMAILSTGSSGSSALSVYTFSGGESVELSLGESFSFKGVESLDAQVLANSDGNVCLFLSIRTKNDDTTHSYKLGFVKSTSSALKPLYMAHQAKANGKVRYYVQGEEVTKAKYAAEKSAFEGAYKKKGSLPVKTIGKSDSGSAIGACFDQLRKHYATFSRVKSIKLSRSTASVEVGKNFSLKAALSPSTASASALKWTSSNESVATVTGEGDVQAVGVGKANITATAESGKKAICDITVTGIAPTGVSLNDTLITMITGNIAELTATIKPSEATSGLTWTSSNGKVASVSKSGQVKAIGVGKATITVTTSNKKKATCQVVVNDKDAVIVDISQHEYTSNMDWETISKNVDLMILRCGVTRTGTEPVGVGKDDRFAYYAKKCQEYSIPFGVYYYGKCSDEETAIEEAEMTWKIASPYKPLFYVYDVEESRLTKSLIETYMKKLKSLGAKKTGYYIAHHLYANYKLDTSLVDFIWLPHYGKNTGAVNSTPSFDCDLHQYTSVGKVPGIPAVVDMSRLMGTKSLAWFLKKA